jgi:hypothetical protein
MYDIEFYEHGTCYFESPFLMNNTLEYSFPEDGKLRISLGMIGEAYDYQIDKDTLRIIFQKWL